MFADILPDMLVTRLGRTFCPARVPAYLNRLSSVCGA